MVSVTAANVQRFVKSNPSTISGYLIYGSDVLQIRTVASAVISGLREKHSSTGDLIRLSEADIAGDPDKILTELSMRPLFGGTNIVSVSSVGAKATGIIQDAVSAPFPDAYLVVEAPDLKKSHKLAQIFEAAPYLAAIACYGEDAASLSTSLRQRLEKLGHQIDNDALSMILDRADGSAALAFPEIEKLSLYAGKNNKITLADVEHVLSDQETAEFSEIVDAALEGNAKEALAALDRVLAVERNITPVLMILIAALQRLHVLRGSVDNGAPASSAIKQLRPPVFFKQQDALLRQVRLWATHDLADLLRQSNAVLLQTRLQPQLAEQITAAHILAVAVQAKSAKRIAR